jgi:hypothetical protein
MTVRNRLTGVTLSPIFVKNRLGIGYRAYYESVGLVLGRSSA